MRAIIASLLCLASVGAAGAQELAKATFAGGCFWCMEPPFDALDGVVSTTSGYTGGHLANPTYEQVSAGKTGHAEAVEIVYDPRKVTYARLLEVFWRNIDPLPANAQFCPAEEYHQDYYKKNPIRYKFYRTSCGRDRRLEAIWGPDAKDRAGVR